MKQSRKVSLAALTLAVFALVALAVAGVFSPKQTTKLPEELSSYRSMSPAELDKVVSSNPKWVKHITFFKGFKSVVADVEPLGPALVDYGDTQILMNEVNAARVPFEISGPTETDAFGKLIGLHWSFWTLLGLSGFSLLLTLWEEGALSKLNLSLPRMGIVSGVQPETTDDEHKKTFDDIAGCEEAIAKLRRVARWLKSPEWYEQFGAKIPKGILAVGPPGTGKTLLARSLAGEVDANFFAVHGSSFVEMFAGVGALRVRKLFDSAIAARKRTGKPSIIFIDEIDAIGKKRSGGSTGADAERDQTLNQLLVCMQGFKPSSGIIVMAATNMADSLDDALKRPGRFDYQVSVDLPDTSGREKIFSIHTSKMKLAANVRIRDLAVRTPQFSGADLEQACNEAAIAAAERVELNREVQGTVHDHELVITLEDFDKGIDYVQFGDPMLSRARAMSEEDKRNTAYHEAGHCAVQQALRQKGADAITKVTIEPRTKSLGSMQSHADGDRYTYTEEQLLARIMTAMGGRLAQEHFMCRKDTGAQNDFEQATRIAQMMVAEFGMSHLEPMSVKLAGDQNRTVQVGAELANEIDNEWRRILQECYENARQIIVENERKIERVAKALLVEQTILAERFLTLWNAQEEGGGSAADKKSVGAPEQENDLVLK